MNIIDFAILAMIAIYICAGMYKGFIWNVAVLGVSVLSCLLALLFMGSVSSYVIAHKSIYDSMLSYTEGAEAIYDNAPNYVEYVKKDITELTNNEINDIMQRAELPYPMGERIYDNIINEEFKARGITALGDYFNETLVMVMINIISFMMVYFAVRVLLTFLTCWIDYSVVFPRLRRADFLVGGCIGIIRGFVGVSVICMLIPIILIVLPFENIEGLVETSKLVSFFYKANLLLKMIPGI